MQTAFETYVKLNKRVPPETLMTVQTIDDPSRLADTIVVHLTSTKIPDRQEILEIRDPAKRIERLFELMNKEIEILQMEKKIRSASRSRWRSRRRNTISTSRCRPSRRNWVSGTSSSPSCRRSRRSSRRSGSARKRSAASNKELKKLKMMQPMSAEATVVRNYVDWILNLPWYDVSEENYDLDEAERILDDDHYGLKKIKERILEYLAVQALVKKLKGTRSLPRGASRCRQDLPRAVHRPSDGA